MIKKTLIGSTTSAANAILVIDNINLNGSVFLFGTDLAEITETVNIQIQTVENPDITNDDHWETFVVNSTSYVLNASNFSRSFDFRGTYRVAKPLSATAFGVRFE